MNTYEISVGGKTYKVELQPDAGASPRSNGEMQYRVLLDGRETAVSCVCTQEARADDGARASTKLIDGARASPPVQSASLSLILNGESFDVHCQANAEAIRVHLRGAIYECMVSDPRSLRRRKKTGLADSGEQKLAASMPGKVVRIISQVGDQIKAGQGILVIEAMKMQNEVRSPKDGQLKKLMVRQGANVVAGEVLAVIE